VVNLGLINSLQLVVKSYFGLRCVLICVGIDVYLTLLQPNIEVKGDICSVPPRPPPHPPPGGGWVGSEDEHPPPAPGGGWVGSEDGHPPPPGGWVGLVFTNINVPPHPPPQKAGVLPENRTA
jgi:hypothetical protein